ncbi:MAG: RNA polymerase subunit sigma [Salinivirgaceae bacterium]|nr:MAG: RNA polymerase subunit sigma [Salinivirgaceae bacterium]
MRQLKITQQITHRDENSVNLYLQEVSKYKLISVEEEVELSVRIHNGDEQALKKLVEANLRFVISVAKQYQNQGLSFSDLINEGNVGLLKAAKLYDETRGFKFISYAVWWIRQSIMQALSEHTRVVRLPLNRLAVMKKISKATILLQQKYERDPSVSEIADFLEIKENQIFENDKIKNRSVSFDKPLFSDIEGDTNLYEFVETDNLPSPDSCLVSESLKIDLARALKKLSTREADIMSLLFGLNNYPVHSLREVAQLQNMTSERIRQIKSVGLIKLRRILSDKNSFHNNL